MKSKPVFCAVIVVAIVAVLICFATQNKRIMGSLMDDFLDIVKDYVSDAVVESKEVYGKLNGNGNGIQYFGAVLIKKDASFDVDALLAELDAKFEIVEAMSQKGQKVESTQLQHQDLTYDTVISDNEQYVTICFYNSNHPKSNLFDIAGH